MGIIVKLLGSGIGLASEALASRQDSNAGSNAGSSRSQRSSSHRSSPRTSSYNGESSSAAAASRPRAAPTNYDDAYGPPPEYVEVSYDTAEELYATGAAAPVDSRDEKYIYSQYQGDKGYEERYDDEGYYDDEEEDEELWNMDDANAALSEEPTNEDSRTPQDPDQLVNNFVRQHPPPAYTPTGYGPQRSQLPCPVILPQRRPRDKKRGFVRAYAPVLEKCGIDQKMFLDFLKTFHASCKADPWLQVVMFGAMGAGMAPSVIAMAVSAAVQVAVGVAMEVQRRSRTNNFLDRMNNEFFKPRGLYCLIMTYKPDANVSHARMNITKAISSSMTPSGGRTAQTFNNLRTSSGKTYGELELPEAAPLIFPALENLADDNSPGAEKKKSKLKSSQKFMADYFDRRAQAKYIGENPGSKLAVGPSGGPKFASRYADPNHATNSGSLIALLSGGRIVPENIIAHGSAPQKNPLAYSRGERSNVVVKKKDEGIIRKMLKKDVLYLMTVNLPSEEELRRAGGRAIVAAEARQ